MLGTTPAFLVDPPALDAVDEVVLTPHLLLCCIVVDEVVFDIPLTVDVTAAVPGDEEKRDDDMLPVWSETRPDVDALVVFV